MGISVRRVRLARLPQADPKPTTGLAFADALLPETPLLETLSKINLGERVLTVGFAPSKIGIVSSPFGTVASGGEKGFLALDYLVGIIVQP